MAKNWTMGEAAHAVREYNKEGVLDLGKRFPLITVLLAQLNDAGIALCDAMPDYITARKLEAALKGDLQEDTDVVAEAEDAVEKVETKNTEMPEPKSWKSMNQYQKKKAKALGDEYVAACKALDKAAVVADEEDGEDEIPAPKKASKRAKKPVVVEEEDDDFDDEEEEEPAPKKAKKFANKAAKKEDKKHKKPAKKVVEEEDEDDDFDDFDFDDDDDE